MPIFALLCGIALSYLATAQGQTSAPPPANTTMDAVAMGEMKMVLDVMMARPPCSMEKALKPMRKYTKVPDCAPENAAGPEDEDEGDDEGDDEGEDDEGLVRRKRWGRRWRRPVCVYWWRPRENTQRECCPQTNQTSVTQGLSNNATNFPAEEIANAVRNFLIVGRTAQQFQSNLAAMAVLPGDIQNLGPVVQPCPSQRVELISYTSPSRNIFCWFVRNLQPPVIVNLQCNQTCCSNCRSTQRGMTNLCFPQFRTFNALGYCPSIPGPNKFVTDRILVPVDCNCRSVQCTCRRNVCRRQRALWGYGW